MPKPLKKRRYSCIFWQKESLITNRGGIILKKSEKSAEIPKESEDLTPKPAGKQVESASTKSEIVEIERLIALEKLRKLRTENDAREGRLVSVDHVLNDVSYASDILRGYLEKVCARLPTDKQDEIREGYEKALNEFRRRIAMRGRPAEGDEEYLVKDEDKKKSGRPRKADHELTRERKRRGHPKPRVIVKKKKGEGNEG